MKKMKKSGEETDQRKLNAKSENLLKTNMIKVKKKSEKPKIIKTLNQFEINNVDITGDKKKGAKLKKRKNNKTNKVADIETRDIK